MVMYKHCHLFFQICIIFQVLMERVFLRVGSADTDEQLQSAIGKFLPPVLLKLSSQQDGVRTKQEIEVKATRSAALLLFMVLPALSNIKIPSDPQMKKLIVSGITDHPDVLTYVLDYTLDVLLLPYGVTIRPPNASRDAPAIPTPPGLSDSSFKRLTSENPLDAATLEKIKLGLLKFLCSGVFEETSVLPHLVIGSSDTRHSIVNCAEMELRRLASNADWNNSAVISKLFSVFLGTIVLKNKNASPEHKRIPASTRIRMKIFPQLLKSKENGIQFPACVQVIFESLFGEKSNTKLKLYAVQYVHHVCDYCLAEQFIPISGVLLSGIIQLIDKNAQDEKLRSFAYVAVGKIGQKCPSQVTSDMILIDRLFKALSQETPEIKIAVQQTLSMLTKAFSNLSGTNKKVMEALILNTIEDKEPQARLASVQYASIVFSDDHILSRYCLLLASGDNKEEVCYEAMKALHIHPISEKNTQLKKKMVFPHFKDIFNFINNKVEDRMKTQHLKYATGIHTLPFYPTVYVNILTYLKLCLASSAGVTATLDQEENRNQIPLIGRYIKSLVFESKLPNNPSSMRYLLEGIAISPDEVVKNYVSEMDVIKSCMCSSNEEMRESASELVACLAVHSFDDGKLKELVDELMNNMSKKTLEAQHGSVLSFGFLIGRLLAQNRFDDLLTKVPALLKAIKEIAKLLGNSNNLLVHACCKSLGEIGRNGPLPLPASDENNQEEISKYVISKKLVNLLESSKVNAKTKEKAALAAGFICSGDQNFPHTKLLINGLFTSAKETPGIDIHFAVGEALSCIALKKASSCHRDVWNQTVEEFESNIQSDDLVQEELGSILDEILQKYVKHTKLSIRQASCVWLLILLNQCKNNKALMDRLMKIQTTMLSLLGDSNDVIQEFASKALGSVYEYGDEAQKQSLVAVLVETLTKGRSNSDNSDVDYEPMESDNETIDSYECDDVDLSEHEDDGVMLSDSWKRIADIFSDCRPNSLPELVRNLSGVNPALNCNINNSVLDCFKKFITNDVIDYLVKTKQEVDGETEVFQEGSLGTDASGGSLSTYKDLCSIATDLNKPDLVYKFMHLANHNAIWSSKKGAAFGFQSIAELAGEKLTTHLPKIIPKLYRYTFDPNTKSRLSFSSIWSSLVPETQKTVDTYFDEIMVDVIENLTNNQWRVREACCAAVSDLLRGRNSDQVIKYLPQLWETCFRVRDDIKESVRIAAESTLKTLNKVSVRLCDVNSGNENAINVILPCLLKTGLTSPAEEVKTMSLKTIVELSRSAGKLLKPHIPLLFVALLESLSTQESSTLNMLSVRLGNSQDTQQKCIQFVDSSVLPELVVRLVDIIKHSVGLSTKAGSAQIVVYLVHHCPQELNPHAGKIMAALLNGAVDRNAALRSCYANALGNLVKCAKDSSVEKLLSRIQEWYIEKNEPSVQESCGLIVQSMVRYSPDTVKSHGTSVFPLAFYAMHAIRNLFKSYTKHSILEEKKEKTIWEDVWIEMTPGTEAGIRIYLNEILQIVQRGLDSQSWSLKSQSGRSVCTIAEKLSSNLPSSYFHKVMNIFLCSLSGRTWSGKETLLQAIAALSVNCKNAWSDADANEDINETVPKITVVEALMKECRKDNIVYKLQALDALADVLYSLNIDYFSETYSVVLPLIQNVDKRDDDDGKESQSNLTLSCFKILGRIWPNTTSTQDQFQVEYCKLLVSHLEVSTWKTQVAILSCLNNFVDRWNLIKKESLNEEKSQAICYDLVNLMIPTLCQCLNNMKYSAVKLEAIKVTKLLMTKLKEGGGDDEKKESERAKKQIEKRKADQKSYDKAKRRRLIQESWLEEFTWAVVRDEKLFCDICTKYPSIADTKSTLFQVNDQPLTVKIASPSLDKLKETLEALSADTNADIKSKSADLLAVIKV
ncbi:Proteasome adapter and scaffold protein ECM29 [Nymphon striatum]|nr:Proteasome adapter and scaffold protein ECM29 [Nymphon striatum]